LRGIIFTRGENGGEDGAREGPLKYLFLAAAIIFLVTFGACGKKEPPHEVKFTPVAATPGEVPSDSLKKDEIKVKIRHEKDGNYTWELAGKDIKQIIADDKILRRHFGPPAEK